MIIKRFFLVSVLLLIFAALGAVGYLYLIRPQSADVGLEFTSPRQVLIGQPFVFSISFSNRADAVLSAAKVSLLLPDGVVFVGQPQDQRITEFNVGEIGPGTISKQDFNLMVLSGSQSLKRLEAKLSYATPGRGTAQFEKKNMYDLSVGQSAVDLKVTAPQKVLTGEKFDFDLTYRNNLEQEVQDLSIHATYPPTFQFISSDKEPAESNHTWEVKNILRNESDGITVTGSALGEAGSFFTIQAVIVRNLLGQTYELERQEATIQVESSPLVLTVIPNGKPDFIGKPGDTANYTIEYQNNSPVTLQNVNIAFKFLGEMFELPQSAPQGAVYNSLTRTFTWSPAANPELRALAPGAKSSFNVPMRLKDNYPITRASDKNFLIRTESQIESPTVPGGTKADRTISVAKTEYKIMGRVEIDSQVLYRDAASGIVNAGVYPPKANQPTQFTVHWILKNYATDVKDVVVSAFLQSGARFTGKIKGSSDTKPTYNPASGEVRWVIPQIPATRGVVSSPLETIFQIEFTPASTDVGRAPIILGETRVEATDLFTESRLTGLHSSIASDIPDDATISGQRYVQQ